MPAESISMRKLKEILRLKYEAKLSHRQIGSSLSISPGTVSTYINRAKLMGIEDWPFSNNGLFPYSGEEAPSLIVVCYLTKTKSTYQPPTHQPTNPPLIIKQTCRQVHK